MAALTQHFAEPLVVVTRRLHMWHCNCAARAHAQIVLFAANGVLPSGFENDNTCSHHLAAQHHAMVHAAGELNRITHEQLTKGALDCLDDAREMARKDEVVRVAQDHGAGAPVVEHRSVVSQVRELVLRKQTHPTLMS